ncbi:MAG: hypothetical protein JXA89_27980 [Anaerolineae bacterium]|nr:hypothetical protein [Anaerolineae bacterium]
MAPVSPSFADLHRQVAFGQSGGKIIWQPRIGCWLTDKTFAGEPYPPPYTGMDKYQIYRELGCSARLYEYNACFRRIEHPSVKTTQRELNETDTEITIHTPVGKQIQVRRRMTSNWHYLTVKWPVETEAELKVAAWREENTDWKWDQAQYEDLQDTVSDLGAPTMYLPRMNVQSLYINMMGVQQGIYAIYDWTDTVEAYFRALEESHDRLIDVINASPVDIINFGENIHAGTLSPDLFEKYHLPACQRRCERLRAAGKFTCSHWDGETVPLLPYAQETGLDGIEAITPQPQGDATLDQVKDALGDNMFLLDGIPAVYFDDTFSVGVLVDCVRRLIDLFAPKLILGISDEISSTGDLDRIKVVGQIVDQYNAQFGV